MSRPAVAGRSAAGWAIAGGLLALLGLALRLHNAFDYPIGKGFDAEANWEYVELLLDDWSIPAPDAAWSTAHPPLFYWMSAGLGRALAPRASTEVLARGDAPEEATRRDAEKVATIHATRVAGSLLGLLAVALAVWLVRWIDPDQPRRALLAGAVLLFAPVHIYTSAMFSDELLAAALTSVACVGLARELSLPDRSDAEGSDADGSGPVTRSAWAPVWIGAAAGLALLTKLSGLLVIGAGALALLLDGWRRGRTAEAITRAALFASVAGAVGGWFYARNLIEYGYLYPQRLDVHAVMGTMPPGARGIADYLTLPLATFLDPRPLRPDLLHSVWGSTYDSAWFDSLRHFLPRHGDAVAVVGQWLVLMGVLPTAAFCVGVGRGLRRLRASPRGPDAVMLILIALTLAGYVLFTWRNPWFVTVKASHLLGLSVPFAYYASDGLTSLTRPGRVASAVAWVYLALLVLVTVVTFWHGWVFAKLDDPGVQWTPLGPAPGA